MKCKRPIHRGKVDQQLLGAGVGGNGEEQLNAASAWDGNFGNGGYGCTRF